MDGGATRTTGDPIPQMDLARTLSRRAIVHESARYPMDPATESRQPRSLERFAGVDDFRHPAPKLFGIEALAEFAQEVGAVDQAGAATLMENANADVMALAEQRRQVRRRRCQADSSREARRGGPARAPGARALLAQFLPRGAMRACPSTTSYLQASSWPIPLTVTPAEAASIFDAGKGTSWRYRRAPINYSSASLLAGKLRVEDRCAEAIRRDKPSPGRWHLR